MNSIETLLNKITMYRLVVYGLILLAVTGVLFASFGRLPVTPIAMIESLGMLVASCFITELALSKVWRRPFNSESWLITALIIFLIFPAPRSGADIFATLLVGVIANASKYLIAWNGKHLFNPAALAVAVSGIIGLQTSTWWVGNSAMWLLTLVFGLLVVAKIRRFLLVTSFAVTAIVMQLAVFAYHGNLNSTAISGALLASPLIFLGTIMLTEPATMPPRRAQQAVFGVLVALLYVQGGKIGPISLYPEFALLIGNVFAFAVAPKFRMRLRLKEIRHISEQVSHFVFIPDRPLTFTAGQYMEWTLPGVAFDNRGNRRTFTIASSPTEDTIQLGAKFYQPSSTYKYALSRMQPGDDIYVSQLAGNFTLGTDEKEKLAFIAGGIGVTPFRSMITYLADTDQKRDISMLYVVNKPEELAYIDDFKKAADVGVRVLPILSDLTKSQQGMISAKLNIELIKELVPDYSERLFYISGPDVMVDATRDMLYKLAVDPLRIKTDHFSGY